jgi:hypothetical protein
VPESSLRVVALIVTWNRREAAAGVIRALRAQRGHGARIRAIVVDNASTDGTAEALAREFRLSRMLVNDTERRMRPGSRKFRTGCRAGLLKCRTMRGRAGSRRSCWCATGTTSAAREGSTRRCGRWIRGRRSRVKGRRTSRGCWMMILICRLMRWRGCLKGRGAMLESGWWIAHVRPEPAGADDRDDDLHRCGRGRDAR